MKKFLKIGIVLIAIAIVVGVVYSITSNKDEGLVTVKPKFGKFLVTVKTTGELKAKNSIDVRGPMNARAIRIWEMKISKLIPEGTVVKEGDIVAELDRSEVMTQLKDTDLDIQKMESSIKQAKLDSSLTLSAARDELENIVFNLEEKKLLLEQSKFEPPAVIRQAEIDSEREERRYKQTLKNYETRTKQEITKISILETDLKKLNQTHSMIMEIYKEFTINAPSTGMVIYARDWNGRRKVVGSNVSSWDPVVATLPDLNEMESLTYVNEVDIQKIKKGQFVKIGLDADPKKKLTGEIVSVANIGEELKNSDSKVFEVIIKVMEKDTTLRPSMTTSNGIVVTTIDNSLYIPLECIHSENNEPFVYKVESGKIVKQKVTLGEMNENEAIILKGLKKTDELLLSKPPDEKIVGNKSK